MKTILIALLLALPLLTGGCSGEKKAAELLETAHFEEKQNNREHAVKLYDEIIGKYPGSPAAEAARERLKHLKQ